MSVSSFENLYGEEAAPAAMGRDISDALADISEGSLSPAAPGSALAGAGEGWSRGRTVRKGFSVFAADYFYRYPRSLDFTSGDQLKLHIRLEGSSHVSSGDDMLVSQANRLSFLVQPPGSAKREAVSANARSRTVTLICARDFLYDLILEGDAMPTPIHDYLAGPVSRFCFRDAPLPLVMRTAAEELLALRTDQRSELMFEAKALELLCLSLRELSPASSADQLKPRSRLKVQSLCELLATAEGMSMSIAQLSRAVAWNETQMMESFRNVTGTTISNFRNRLRMERALAELRNTDRSITEIAYDAGYEHPSNFATAFRRTFGVTPRMSRTAFTD